MFLFECTNPVFNITNENISFPITILGHWNSKFDKKTIDELNKFLELRSLEKHVKEVGKRGNQIKVGVNEYILSDFDAQRNEILEKLKNVKYNGHKDLVYRFQLTYDEFIDKLDLKCIPTKRAGYSLNRGNYGVFDLNNTLKFVLPDNAKVNVTVDDI